MELHVKLYLDYVKNSESLIEKAFTLEEAFEMDEFFLTSTTSEVMPVISIDGRPIGSGMPGTSDIEVTKSVQLANSILNSG